MPKDLKHQIETHLASFPERLKDVQEMQKEWAEWKSKTFWLMVSFITSMLGIGIWVGTMQAEMSGIHEDVTNATEHHEQYDQRLTSLEVNNGEIRARLSSIESTLQEIKVAIIKLQ